MKKQAPFVLLLALLLIACGSDGSDPGADDGGSSDNGGSQTEAPTAGGDGTATVLLDGTTYDFTGATCVTAGSILLGFEDGEDMGSITSAGDVTLIRLEIDGAQYVDGGSAPPPDETGNGFTWSGQMSELNGGEAVEVEITYNC